MTTCKSLEWPTCHLKIVSLSNWHAFVEVFCAAPLFTRCVELMTKARVGICALNSMNGESIRSCARVFSSCRNSLKSPARQVMAFHFGVPHPGAEGKSKNSDYFYSKFECKLRRIREVFPVNDVETLEKFETCHLEWLAVFLSVRDWRPRPRSSDTSRVRKT